MPQVSGELGVAGLTAPVRVVRDTWGVPHIYAQNDGDLFFAQGFVQAQDRLFQMDLWRRSAQGRLSEVLGPNFIERDAMTRRMQYRGDAGGRMGELRTGRESDRGGLRARRERMGRRSRASGRPRNSSSPGGSRSRGRPTICSIAPRRSPRAETRVDEVFRARLVAAVGAARARLLLPGDRALDMPAGLDVAAVPALVTEAIRRAGTPPFFLGLAAPVTDGTVRLKPDTADARPRRLSPVTGFSRTATSARSIIRRSGMSSTSTRPAGM